MSQESLLLGAEDVWSRVRAKVKTRPISCPFHINNTQKSINRNEEVTKISNRF